MSDKDLIIVGKTPTGHNIYKEKTEAAKIAVAVGQVRKGIDYLFSEDLY